MNNRVFPSVETLLLLTRFYIYSSADVISWSMFKRSCRKQYLWKHRQSPRFMPGSRGDHYQHQPPPRSQSPGKTSQNDPNSFPHEQRAEQLETYRNDLDVDLAMEQRWAEHAVKSSNLDLLFEPNVFPKRCYATRCWTSFFSTSACPVRFLLSCRFRAVCRSGPSGAQNRARFRFFRKPQ